jgi:hypothetical protein
MRWRGLLGTLLGASATVAVMGGARAATPKVPSLELIEIHAVQSDAGPASVDKQLHEVPLHIKEKPFSSYNVFKQLDHKTLPLDKPATYSLANGRTLTVTLSSVTEPDAGAGDAGTREKRYQLDTQISEPPDAGKAPFLKAHFTASANEPFWVWGQSFQGGTLVLELVVRP